VVLAATPANSPKSPAAAPRWRQADLGDLFLALVALLALAAFCAVPLQNYVSILDGSYRSLTLPDGRSSKYDARLTGWIEGAEITQKGIALKGWVLNRGDPNEPLGLTLFRGGKVMLAFTPTDARADVEASLNLQASAPGFDVLLPLAPGGEEGPFRLFVFRPDGSTAELFETDGPLTFKQADAMAAGGAPPTAPSWVDKRTPAPGPLERGDRLLNPGLRADALLIQDRLAALGFYRGQVDGSWGKASRDALARFRRAEKLDTGAAYDRAVQGRLFLHSGK